MYQNSIIFHLQNSSTCCQPADAHFALEFVVVDVGNQKLLGVTRRARRRGRQHANLFEQRLLKNASKKVEEVLNDMDRDNFASSVYEGGARPHARSTRMHASQHTKTTQTHTCTRGASASSLTRPSTTVSGVGPDMPFMADV